MLLPKSPPTTQEQPIAPVVGSSAPAFHVTTMQEVRVRVEGGQTELEGGLTIPERCRGIILFAHGSGSGRASPRNTYVARMLNEDHIGTALFDLLTREGRKSFGTRLENGRRAEN